MADPVCSLLAACAAGPSDLAGGLADLAASKACWHYAGCGVLPVEGVSHIACSDSSQEASALGV